MKEMSKRAAVAALAGVMAMGMLTGCGEKKLDGTKTVATVNGTEIPMGVLSVMVRHSQIMVWRSQRKIRRPLKRLQQNL